MAKTMTLNKLVS